MPDLKRTLSGIATNQQAAANNDYNMLNRTLSQYEGDLTKTPMYNRLLTSGVDSTAQAYDRVRGQRALRARMTGVGGQGTAIGEGDQIAIGNAEASDMSRVPLEAMQTLMPLQMQAAGLREGEAGARLGASGNALNNWTQYQIAQDQQKKSMWSRIAKIGVGALMAPATGGASLAGAIQ